MSGPQQGLPVSCGSFGLMAPVMRTALARFFFFFFPIKLATEGHQLLWAWTGLAATSCQTHRPDWHWAAGPESCACHSDTAQAGGDT